jgi:hypothetical protein
MSAFTNSGHSITKKSANSTGSFRPQAAIQMIRKTSLSQAENGREQDDEHHFQHWLRSRT